MKLCKLFFSSNLFFDQVKKEKKYLPVLFYFALYFTVFRTLGFFISNFRAITPLQLIGFFVGLVIGALGIPFFMAGLIHLGVLIFGGKQGYYATFKAITYARVVPVFYSFLLGLLALPLTKILREFQGQPEVITHVISGYLPLIFLLIFLFIINVVHYFFVATIGLAKYQKLSKGSALIILFLFEGVIPALIGLMIAVILFFFGVFAFLV